MDAFTAQEASADIGGQQHALYRKDAEGGTNIVQKLARQAVSNRNTDTDWPLTVDVHSRLTDPRLTRLV